MSGIQHLNRAALAHAIHVSNPLEKVALNPQPLPPRIAASAFRDEVALNPQPLPPRSAFLASILDRIALNPQPLPPKAAWDDEFCGNVRRPVPPRPHIANEQEY